MTETIERVHLDAGDIAPDVRYDWWQQCLTSAMYPVIIEPAGLPASRFRARFDAARVGPTSLSQGLVDPVTSVIDRRSAQQSPADAVQFTVSGRHARYLRVRGEWMVVPAGTLVVHDATVACTHHSDERDSLTMITVPRESLSVGEKHLRELMLRPLPIESAACRVLRGAAGAVLDPTARFPEAAAATYLIGAADVALRSVSGLDPDHAGTAAARRRQALDFVGSHLADPDLSVAGVAAELKLSPRRLQHLFEADGGLSHVVRRLRVERAIALLAGPQAAELSVDGVARRCGFRDRSAFSRACLAVSGRRPSELRAGNVDTSALRRG